MSAVLVERGPGIVPRCAARTAVPAVRSAVTAAAGAAFARAARSSAAQAGQRLGDGFGGIRRGGVTGFGGHTSILHAT